MYHCGNYCFRTAVARSQSDSDSDADAELVAETVQEGGIVGDDIQDFGGGNFSPAPGVKTVCVFPKNPVKGKLIAVVCPFMKLKLSLFF